jgi:hypothetical protein
MYLAGRASVTDAQLAPSHVTLRCWQLAAAIAVLWAVVASSATWRTGQRLQALQRVGQDNTQRQANRTHGVPESSQTRRHAVLTAFAPDPDVRSALYLRQIAITDQWDMLERGEPAVATDPPITYWNASRRLVPLQTSPIRTALGL